MTILKGSDVVKAIGEAFEKAFDEVFDNLDGSHLASNAASNAPEGGEEMRQSVESIEMSVALKVVAVMTQPIQMFDMDVWIKSYADTPCGRGEVKLTDKRSDALEFPGFTAAMEFYHTQSKTKPLRPDGRPNRPITAYTVEIS